MARLNFREEQKRNVRRTWLLIAAFIGLVVLIGFVFGYAIGGNVQAAYMGIGIGAFIGVVMSLVAVFEGHHTVLGIAGAREITEWKTADEQKLWNCVEEMALAAGLPRPRCYIIETPVPNAFACGRNPKVACVAVTRGLLQQLDRDELQAVVAHEMGHIRNYDVLYTVVVAVLVGLVVMLSDMFLRSMFWGAHRHSGSNSGGSRDNQGQAIAMVIGIVLAILAPLLAQLLFFAVSREREYLADATAVELTRNPKGLANALQKIAGQAGLGRQLQNRGTAHLYIINPMKGMSGATAQSMFATHPPLQARIDRALKMAGEYGAEGSLPPDSQERV